MSNMVGNAGNNSYTPQRLLGVECEAVVARFLKENGYEIKERNYQMRFGEVDIIAYKEPVLAFVEVKARINPTFSISEVITSRKQAKIVKTALHYIASHTATYAHRTIYRFDVALVEIAKNSTDTPKINYITNAFTAS